MPAIFRDEEKLHAYRGPGASKSSIDIYSCAGKLIRSINVRTPARSPVCINTRRLTNM
jgi:hypothetical protein